MNNKQDTETVATDASAPVMEPDVAPKELKAQADEYRKMLKELKEQVKNASQSISDLENKKESAKKEIKKLECWKYIVPMGLWCLMVAGSIIATIILTYAFWSVVSPYTVKSELCLVSKQQLEELRKEIGTLKSAQQNAQPLPVPSVSNSLTVEHNDTKVKLIEGVHNPFQHADTYTQTMWSLAYLCSLFVVALVIMVLAPLRYILRKQDDYN